jgi:hypothetical protein
MGRTGPTIGGHQARETTMTARTLGLVLLLTLAPAAAHAEKQDDLERARQAKAKLPLEKIAGPHRERILEILDKPLFYRRSRVEAFPCDPDLLEWLINHPTMVSEYWRRLGLQVNPVAELEDGYECRENDNLTVRFHVAYQSAEMRILYCIGEAKRPPLPGKHKAEMVLVHRYRFSRSPDGMYYVVQQVDGYVSAKGPTLKFVMKVADSTCEQVIDRCLEDMMIYFSVLCRIVQLRPHWALATLEEIRKQGPIKDDRELAIILQSLPTFQEADGDVPLEFGHQEPAKPAKPTSSASLIDHIFEKD